MPDDDAVICTVDRTYTVRSVVLSNTVMITSVSTSDANAVTVRDEIHDVLEVAPCLPRLHRIDELLAGLEFGEDSTLDQDMEDEDVDLSAARRNTANVSSVQPSVSHVSPI
jgi:sister chromatid cohesion protein DCC1